MIALTDTHVSDIQFVILLAALLLGYGLGFLAGYIASPLRRLKRKQK